MAIKLDKAKQTGSLLLVMAIIVVQLVAAWILNLAANGTIALLIAVLAIGLVIGLSLLRFVLWGYAHRHYPLSHIYPLTALFFPCIVLVSYWQGDAIGATEIVGTALITIGVIIMSSTGATKASNHG